VFDGEAKQFLKEHRQVSQDYQDAAITAILENPKLTEGMMTDIKGNFPLKGVSEREEVMAIGDLSLDPHTMKHIFGTDDYSKISERFEPLKDEKGNPYIGYNVEGSKEVIPVAARSFSCIICLKDFMNTVCYRFIFNLFILFFISINCVISIL
jgi:hypothetical protein